MERLCDFSKKVMSGPLNAPGERSDLFDAPDGKSTRQMDTSLLSFPPHHLAFVFVVAVPPVKTILDNKLTICFQKKKRKRKREKKIVSFNSCSITSDGKSN